MISEKICFEILSNIAIRTVEFKRNIIQALEPQSWHDDSSMYLDHVYLILCYTYQIPDLDIAIRWLKYNELVEEKRAFDNPFSNSYLKLTTLGKDVVENGKFFLGLKERIYRDEDPYAVFIAHQFSRDDESLVSYIDKRVLNPIGLKLVSGRVDGLEEFRHTILKKIRECRFFLCLLTKRVELPSGQYASSTWLYQETGAALAYGKKPLLLVEEGIDSHYVGEFQKVYEHISFNRSNHPDAFESIQRRFINDLDANHIPLPAPLT